MSLLVSKLALPWRPSFLCDNSKSGVGLGLGREQAADGRVRTINCYRIEWGNWPRNTESTRANSRISALSIGGVRIQQLTKCTGSTTGIEPFSLRGKKMVFGHKKTLQSQLTMLHKKKHGKKTGKRLTFATTSSKNCSDQLGTSGIRKAIS